MSAAPTASNNLDLSNFRDFCSGKRYPLITISSLHKAIRPHQTTKPHTEKLHSWLPLCDWQEAMQWLLLTWTRTAFIPLLTLFRIAPLIVRMKPACQTLWPKLQPGQTADKYTWEICRERRKCSCTANHTIPYSSSLTREEQGSKTKENGSALSVSLCCEQWRAFYPMIFYFSDPFMHHPPVIFSLWHFHSSIYFKAFQNTTHSFSPHGTRFFLSPLAWTCKAPPGSNSLICHLHSGMGRRITKNLWVGIRTVE